MFLDLLDEIGPLGHLAKDNVLAIEPRGHDSGDEELRPVGVWASICHAEEEGTVVTELEVLVGELVPVDGLCRYQVSRNSY